MVADDVRRNNERQSVDLSGDGVGGIQVSPAIRVGICGFVEGSVIGDSVELCDAEQCGDVLRYGDHQRLWDLVASRNGIDGECPSRVYDYYPRGRMVFLPRNRTARLYVDECLGVRAIADMLKFFGYAHCRLEIETGDRFQSETPKTTPAPCSEA
jgi:hypothetical protein